MVVSLTTQLKLFRKATDKDGYWVSELDRGQTDINKEYVEQQQRITWMD